MYLYLYFIQSFVGFSEGNQHPAVRRTELLGLETICHLNKLMNAKLNKPANIFFFTSNSEIRREREQKGLVETYGKM